MIVKSIVNTGVFILNGRPYQRGGYEIILDGNRVGFKNIQDRNVVFVPAHFSEWTDETGTPYATLQDLLSAVEAIFFLTGKSDFVGYLYTAEDYDDLVASHPSAEVGTLAYVYNAQGTQWLPGPIGGTYYPNGTYVYTPSGWTSDENAIAESLNQIASKADATDPRFPTIAQKDALQGTDGVPSNTDRYVTDSDIRNTNARTPLPHTHTPAEVGLGNVPNVDATNPSNIIQDSTHRFVSDGQEASWDAKQNALGYTPENVANKGIANGYPTLDSGGRVPSSQLPVFVDEVQEYPSLLLFPATGISSVIYIDTSTDKEYRWTGTTYHEISASPGNTDAVPEGPTNLYFTTARVLSTTITGLVLTSNAVITAADTILSALGKLQAQISLRALASRNITAGNLLTGGGDLTTDRTISVADSAPNVVLAGPATGSANGVTTARALVPTDIPALAESKIIGLTTDLASKVDKTTTVNSKALTTNIVLTTTDITEATPNLYFTVARVLATALTGLVTTTSNAVIIATDSILVAFGKLQAQINAILATTINGKPLSANVVLTTTDIAEGTNLYFTVARVLATLLTGLSVVTTTPILAADSILIAFGKAAALLPLAAQKLALVGNNGTPSGTNRYITETGLVAALGQAGVAATRALNTAFQVSATKFTRVAYTINISATISLSGSQAGTASLQTSPDNITFTEIARFTYGSSGALTIGINLTTNISSQLSAFGIPGAYYKIVTSGTATVTYVAGQETTFG